jgi:death on curing protein
VTDYLTTAEVVIVHDAESDAPLLSWSLLDSAVAVVAQTFDGHDLYPTLHLKVGALMRRLACNHAVEDGNKRCALIAARLMYARNNYLLNAPDVDLLHLVNQANGAGFPAWSGPGTARGALSCRKRLVSFALRWAVSGAGRAGCRSWRCTGSW